MLDSERMIEVPTYPKPVHTRPRSGLARAVRIVLVLVVLAVAAGVIYRGIRSRISTATAVKQETLYLSVPSVSVVHPKLGSATNEVVLPGSIQAFIDSPIYARASGYVKQWYTDIGTRVKAGQALAEIDAPELDQQVTQAKGALAQTQAAVEQAVANLQQGRANEELARVTAQRWSNLVTKGAVSRQENDTYQAQYQAQAANVESLAKAVAAARSNLDAAQANLGRLQDLQAFKIVRAPFDGVITARNTDYGALINAGNGGLAQETVPHCRHQEAARVRECSASLCAVGRGGHSGGLDAGRIPRTPVPRPVGAHGRSHGRRHSHAAVGSGSRQ